LPPEELLAWLDRVLARYTGPTRQTRALCYAEVDGCNLRVVNAGGIPPYIRRADGRVERVKVGGLPLGTGHRLVADYRTADVVLAPDDLCILTSDGVVEANVSRMDLLGFRRLERALAAGPGSNPQAMLDHLQSEISAFVGDAEQHDDITIVVCQVAATASVLTA
jgi:serine phosphatase RsbU (regulator of sigma subunit)